MFDQRIVLIGVLADIVGSAAYIRDIARGHSQPNRATFALWTLAPLIAGVAEITEGVGWASVPALASGLLPAFILAASLMSRGAQWKLGWFDYACAVLSLLALVLWKLSGSGNVAIVLSIAADFLAAVPTLRKSYISPESETAAAYLAAGFSGITGLLVAKDTSFASLGFNLYLVVICAVLSLLILVPRSHSPIETAAELGSHS